MCVCVCVCVWYFAGRFTICHKTEVMKNTLNPVWQPFTIPVRALCNGDYDRSENSFESRNGQLIKCDDEIFNFYLDNDEFELYWLLSVQRRFLMSLLDISVKHVWFCTISPIFPLTEEDRSMLEPSLQSGSRSRSSAPTPWCSPFNLA